MQDQMPHGMDSFGKVRNRQQGLGRDKKSHDKKGRDEKDDQVKKQNDQGMIGFRIYRYLFPDRFFENIQTGLDHQPDFIPEGKNKNNEQDKVSDPYPVFCLVFGFGVIKVHALPVCLLA
jgi:hypothetical protein